MKLMGLTAAAGTLGVSRETIRKWARDGNIDSIEYDMGGGKTGYLVLAAEITRLHRRRDARNGQRLYDLQPAASDN